VRIRSRNPWVLARRRLFGWKVRLLTAKLHQRPGMCTTGKGMLQQPLYGGRSRVRSAARSGQTTRLPRVSAHSAAAVKPTRRGSTTDSARVVENRLLPARGHCYVRRHRPFPVVRPARRGLSGSRLPRVAGVGPRRTVRSAAPSHPSVHRLWTRMWTKVSSRLPCR
jgi:hypothetical protein